MRTKKEGKIKVEDSIIFIFMGIGIVITLIIIGSVVGSMNKKELKESITSLPKQQKQNDEFLEPVFPNPEFNYFSHYDDYDD